MVRLHLFITFMPIDLAVVTSHLKIRSFRGTTGDVNLFDVVAGGKVKAMLHGIPAHLFCFPVGSSINMTVGARLVAELAYVDLQHGRFHRQQWAPNRS